MKAMVLAAGQGNTAASSHRAYTQGSGSGGGQAND